jgi:hypothetical protein
MPRLASLSEVQHRLCCTNQMKNLHLLGAQVLQTLSAGSNEIDP